ncbi:putative odorant receptor 92a [Zophobas morio]|uniref:putative odorant receptor 92a n=1 Tax=Zophobas morio TaxID=2755281 RepID=UPI00308323A7
MDEVYHDWKNTINLNIIFLKIMGLWPRKNEIYKPGLYMVYSSLMVTLVVVCHIATQVINIYFVRNQLETVVAIVYILLINITASFKVFFVIINMKQLQERMTVSKSNWFPKSNHQQKVLIESSIKSWISSYRMLVVICVSWVAFSMTYPLLDASVEEKRLPFLAWYPYDHRISPLYEITYGFQVISSSYLAWVHLTIDNLMYIVNVYTKCQFDILSDNLRNFTKISNDFNKGLIVCILHHKRILSFVEGCKFFNWIFVCHLIINGVAIGITMFQLTMVAPFSSEFYSLFTYGFAITIQIFMFCWHGNEVELSSDLVSYAAFESDWTELPADYPFSLSICQEKFHLSTFALDVQDVVEHRLGGTKSLLLGTPNFGNWTNWETIL